MTLARISVIKYIDFLLNHVYYAQNLDNMGPCKHGEVMLSSRLILVIAFPILIISLFVMGCRDKDNPVAVADTSFAVQSAFVGYTNHYLDVDSGIIDTLIGSDIPSGLTDLRNAFSGFREIHSTIVLQTGRTIAFIGDLAFSEVTSEYVDSATFTDLQIDIPFDSVTVLLIETDLGAVYKLGNPVEDFDGVRFDYQLLLEAEVP